MGIYQSSRVLLLCSVLLTGCKTTHFELELRPDGDALHRRVTMWSEDGEGEKRHLVEFRIEDLQRIAEIYETDVPDELVAKHVFERAFSGAMPNDLGGVGWYLHGATSMGAVFAYSERFGDDEVATNLRTRELAANVFLDLLIAWLESEFGDAPDFPQFRDFVDDIVREDFWNLVLYMWGYDGFAAAALPQGQELDEDALLTDLGVRLILYLAARDYFDPAQLPQLVAAGGQAEKQGDPKPLLEMISRGIASKMGVPADQPLPTPLAALVQDSERLEASIEAFDTESDIAKNTAEAWNRSEFGGEQIEFGDDSVLGELLDQAFLSDFSFLGAYKGGDRLTATLQIPVEPLLSNGSWNPDIGLTWSGMTGGSRFGQNLPIILYATWSDANEDFQNEHFGRLVAQGEDLVNYWLWHAGLSENQLKQWDTFISSLLPGPGLAQDLLHFCLPGDEKDCAVSLDLQLSAYNVVNDILFELRREAE